MILLVNGKPLDSQKVKMKWASNYVFFWTSGKWLAKKPKNLEHLKAWQMSKLVDSVTASCWYGD